MVDLLKVHGRYNNRIFELLLHLNPMGPVSTANKQLSLLAAALLTVLALFSCNSEEAGESEPQRLFAEEDSLQGPFARAHLIAPGGLAPPGDTTWVALVFEIEEGWHLYWDGLNDSGLPPTVKWNLPPGTTVGKILWPQAHRKISPGNVLDHVYEQSVALAVPVVNFHKTAKLKLEGKVEWLVCRDVCLAESSKVEIEIPTGTSGTQIDNRIVETLRDQPTPLPASVSLQWRTNTLLVESDGAAQLRFLPFSDCAFPANLARDGEAEGSKMEISFEAISLDKGVHGILEVQTSNGTTRHLLQARHPDHPAG